jgi:hypothetical protein
LQIIVCVAVITGENPNVMYELGLAHAIYKPTLLICENDRGGHLPTLPFDLQTQDVVGYSRSDLSTLQDAIHRKLAMTVPHD